MSSGQQLQPSLLPFPETADRTKPRRRSKQHERDPLLDHAAVKLYREVCHLWPNHVQRQQVASVVGDSVAALALYREVLTQFMAEGQPKQRADWTIERFQKAQQLMAERLSGAQSDSEFSPAAIRARLMRLSLALAEAADARRRYQADHLCDTCTTTAVQLYDLQNKMVDDTVDVRELDAALNSIDSLLAEAVRQTASPAEVEAAQAIAQDHLKQYRGQMEVGAYNEALDRLVQRHLREQLKVPRVSLSA